jgi:hypothetical protein
MHHACVTTCPERLSTNGSQLLTRGWLPNHNVAVMACHRCEGRFLFLSVPGWLLPVYRLQLVDNPIRAPSAALNMWTV